MRRARWIFCCALACGGAVHAEDAAMERLVNEIQTASFPELTRVNLSIRAFHGDTSFFMAQFKLAPFLLGAKMQYVLRVNPKAEWYQVPEAGRRAIVAHELCHVVYYARAKRMRLFGLVRLVSGGYRSRFERAADLETIRRGYGEGLKEYRRWLYRTIPAKALRGKQKDYLSPEEIDEVIRRAAGG